MDNSENLFLLNEHIQKNSDKIKLVKEKEAALEAEGKKIEFDRMQLIIGDYLHIINELGLSPAEFRELLGRENLRGQSGRRVIRRTVQNPILQIRR